VSIAALASYRYEQFAGQKLAAILIESVEMGMFARV
jgi:hypothetical protein